MLQVVSTDDGFFLFVRVGDTLYCRSGSLGPLEERGDDPWQVIGRVGSMWTASVVDGRPVAFDIDQSSQRLRGSCLEAGGWEPLVSLPMLPVGEVCVLDDDEPGSYMVVSGGFPGSLSVRLIRNGEAVARFQHGSGLPFPRAFLALMLVPHLGSLTMPASTRGRADRGVCQEHARSSSGRVAPHAPEGTKWKRCSVMQRKRSGSSS